MKHNDVRRSLCYDCACFAKEEFSGKYVCVENGVLLRVDKHKVPLKHQGCKGPHDDMSTVLRTFDEFANTTPEERAAMYEALEHGKVNKTMEKHHG